MVTSLNPSQSILGLDIGDARIGVARANVIARIPEPLAVIQNDESIEESISELLMKHDVGLVVVGLPRNLSGAETPQSAKIRDFVGKIEILQSVPTIFVDESLSSKRADDYLREHPEGGIAQDAIAACYILEELFTNNGEYEQYNEI